MFTIGETHLRFSDKNFIVCPWHNHSVKFRLVDSAFSGYSFVECHNYSMILYWLTHYFQQGSVLCRDRIIFKNREWSKLTIKVMSNKSREINKTETMLLNTVWPGLRHMFSLQLWLCLWLFHSCSIYWVFILVCQLTSG